MAISIVSSVVSGAASGANITLPLTGGAENDIVVTFGGFAGGTAVAPGVISPSGYTSVYVRDDANNDFKVEWKRLGSSPDPSVLLAGSGDANDPTVYGLYLLRGVSRKANPFDATIKTSVASGVPQAPSIITASNNAMVLALAGNDNNDGTQGTVSNFANVIGQGVNDTDDFSAGGAASIIAVAGTIAPAAWSTWTSGNYVAATVALKEDAGDTTSITLDATSGPVNQGGVSSLTFAHTCSGSNRILFAAFRDRQADTTLISGVTYAGVAMTQINGIRVPGERYITLWYLIDPEIGTNNIVVTLGGVVDDIWGAAVSYEGANQSGQPESQIAETVASGTSFTSSVVSVSDNDWAVLFHRGANPGGTIVAGTGTTARVFDTAQGTGIGDSGGPKTPAGAINMQITWTNSAAAAHLMASFAPVQSAAVTSKLLQLLGVGV